jgi:hypothetical protein
MIIFSFNKIYLFFEQKTFSIMAVNHIEARGKRVLTFWNRSFTFKFLHTCM